MQKAWDCDLPDNPYLRARYWADKAQAADHEAARRTGPEAITWRIMARCWRDAIENLRYPPMALPRRALQKLGR